MEFIDNCKALFIFSVAIAHCPISPKADNSASWFASFWNDLGTIGVIGFFIFAGFFFACRKINLHELLYKKTRTLLIPWIVCGTLVYLVSSLMGSQKMKLIDIVDKYPSFIIGDGSLYYFLTILILLFIIYNFIYSSKFIVVITLVISPVSIVLTQLGIFGSEINPYLNPFNWISFFALGVVIKNFIMDDLYQIEKLIQKNRLIIAIAFIFALTISVSTKQNTYFHFINIFTEIFGVAIIILISTKINSAKIARIGEFSFAIYLLHIPLAGLINILFYNESFLVFQILKPFIVISSMFVLISMYIYIISKIKNPKIKEVLYVIIGIREK